MATSTREARRRRIVERGEDRLALITGRIQALDSSSSSSSSQPQQQPEPEPQLHHAHTFSSPPLLSRQDQIRYDFRSDRSFVTPDDDIDENDVPSTLLPKHETGNESPSNAAADSGNQVEPQLRKCETNVDTMRSPPLDISSPVSSTVEDSSKITPSDTRPLSRAEPRSHHPKLFTAKRISSSITASENSRILCSITIALLVVLSHLSLPILSGGIVKSFLTSRPLYLVLLGNITIVLARLLFGKRGGSKKAEEEARKTPSEEPNGSKAMDVGKALDTGLLMYKAFRAAFMDCSVYAVIVVCGLSLLQRSL